MKEIIKPIWCRECVKNTPHILAVRGFGKATVSVEGRCTTCGIYRYFRFTKRFWDRVLNSG